MKLVIYREQNNINIGKRNEPTSASATGPFKLCGLGHTIPDTWRPVMFSLASSSPRNFRFAFSQSEIHHNTSYHVILHATSSRCRCRCRLAASIDFRLLPICSSSVPLSDWLVNHTQIMCEGSVYSAACCSQIIQKNGRQFDRRLQEFEGHCGRRGWWARIKKKEKNRPYFSLFITMQNNAYEIWMSILLQKNIENFLFTVRI